MTSFSSITRILYFSAFCLFPLSRALADPVITDFKIIGPNIRIVVENVPAADELRVQSSGTLGTWPKLNNATVVNNGGGKFTITATKPAVASSFYRAISIQLDAGVDPDGDGLPTALEDSENSDFALFDTDDDGFSDGVEFANGTNMNDVSDFPKLASLPSIEFESATQSFVEGSTPKYTISLTSNSAFTGPVSYRINTRSTVPSSDYTLGGTSGTVMFNGSSGTIEVTFIDDYAIKPTRILFLELTPVGFSAGYRVGGGSNHIVCLCENDCYWTGVIKDDLLSRDVRLRVLRKTGQLSQIAFVAGNADGLNDIDGGQSSQSTGIVPPTPEGVSPKDVWVATGVSDTTTMFSATSPALPVPISNISRYDGSTVRITEEPLTRTLTISAETSLANQVINRDQSIVGRFTETIMPADVSKTYLKRTRQGIAVFMKELPSPPEIEVVTIPTPAP